MNKEEQVQLLNMLANQPEIRPHLAPNHLRLDLTDFFNSDANMIMGGPRGVVAFIFLGKGVYSAHYLLTSSLRGQEAMAFIKSCFTALFTYRDALAITGSIPRENLASRVMTRALGCRPIGECIDTQGRACTNYIMERRRWAILSGA